MSLFKQNTESALINKLTSIKDHPAGWSALILKGQLLNANQRRELKTKQTHMLFLKLMETESVVPYFCHDGDVIFIFCGPRKYYLDVVKKFMCTVFPQYEAKEVILDSSFEYYLLSDSFEHVCEIVYKKEALFGHKVQKQFGHTFGKKGMQVKNAIWSEERFKIALKKREYRDSKLLLLVEDDDLQREFACNVLRSEFKVKTAHNARYALTQYNNNAPDIVFLDINMPDKNGIELLEQLIQYDPDPTIIMFSVDKTSETVLKALQLGAKGFVVKPFTPDALLKYARKFAND